MNIRPSNDRVIVKRIEIEPTGSGGIFLTGSAAAKSDQFEVVAVGKGRVLESGYIQPLDVNVGDIVIVNESDNMKVKEVDNEELLIISASDILAFVEA